MKKVPVTVFAAVASLSLNATLKTAADYDVGDYVQDGLIAHYDGIRNAGATQPHDSEAKKWVDLVSGNNMTFCGTNDEAAASGKWTGGNSYAFNSSYARMSNAVDLGRNITVQVAIDVDFEAQTAAYDETKKCTYVTYVGTTADYGVFTRPTSRTSLEWKADIWCGTRAKYSKWEGRYINLITTDGFSYVGQNAVYEGETERTKNDDFNGYQWTIGGAHLSDSKNVDIRLSLGRFYSARFYNRPLGESELAQNRKVDEVRFRGAVYTNVVVEASVYAGVGGIEAAGVYEVVGSHTFTAPDVTAGGVLYRAIGYTIETWNGKFWSSAKRFDGATYTYTVSEDSPAVRLTWLWKAVRGIRAMSDYDACDYVQGALIAQYDGIRNAGAALAHDSEAAVWQDLKSPDNYMTFNGTTDVAAATGEWNGGNAYKFNGFSYARMVAPINLGSNITVQLAVDIDNAAQERNYNTLYAGWLGYPLYFSAEKDSGPFAKVYHEHASQGRYLEWKDSGETGSGASTGRAKLYSWNYKYITAVTTDERAYLFEEDDYCADESLSGTPKSFARTKWGEFKNYRWSVGGTFYENPDNVNKYLTIGKYHSARFYNRPLTSEELIWNRRVDEIRFRGAAYTNVVVASSRAKAEGVQKNGAYEVLDEGEFTAVAVNTVKGGRNVTYIPTGYTVERLSDGKWSKPEEYTGTSYTYNVEKESGQIVRLTWMWRSEGLGTVITIK